MVFRNMLASTLTSDPIAVPLLAQSKVSLELSSFWGETLWGDNIGGVFEMVIGEPLK